MSPLSRHRDGRASTSRHARKVCRQNKALSRQVHRMAVHGRSAFATLMAVLAQKGGEVVVTRGTMEQVLDNLPNLSYAVEPVKDSTADLTVRLVVADVPATDVPAADVPEEKTEPDFVMRPVDDPTPDVHEERHGDAVV